MKQSCSGRVYEGRMTSSFGCSKPATRQHGGKWWCFQHDPREKEKAQKTREEKYKREQQVDDQKQHKADLLLKRLKVAGCIQYHWKRGYMSAIVISFDEAEKLLKELGR